MNIGFPRKTHETLAGIVDRPGCFFLPAPPLLPCHRREDAVCLVPCRAFGRGNDRAKRNVEPWLAPESRCLPTERCDALAGRGERLAVDGIDIAAFGAHGERAGRGAAEEKQRMRLLQRADIRARALDGIELAGEIERPLVRPGELHQLEILGPPPIALRLRAEVAVPLLLVIRLAGDD